MTEAEFITKPPFPIVVGLEPRLKKAAESFPALLPPNTIILSVAAASVLDADTLLLIVGEVSRSRLKSTLTPVRRAVRRSVSFFTDKDIRPPGSPFPMLVVYSLISCSRKLPGRPIPAETWSIMTSLSKTINNRTRRRINKHT